jgi:hypothetical protein
MKTIDLSVNSSCLHPVFGPGFTPLIPSFTLSLGLVSPPYPLFQEKGKDRMKLTQFTTKIGGKKN